MERDGCREIASSRQGLKVLNPRGGIIRITELCEGVGKRELPITESDSPGAKQRKFEVNL